MSEVNLINPILNYLDFQNNLHMQILQLMNHMENVEKLVF